MVLGMLLAVQTHPMPPEGRWLLDVLLLALGLVAFAIFRVLLPRYWQRNEMTLGGILFGCVGIGLLDFLIRDIDLAPLYIVVIIMTAMLSGRRPALVAAACASVTQLSVAVLAKPDVLSQFPQFLMRSGVYFITAFLVTELASALTEQWRQAAASAEERQREMVRRNEELQALHDISRAFGNLDNVRETFHQVTEHMAHLLGAQMCAVLRIDESGRTVQGMPPGFGLTDEEVGRVTFRIDAASADFWDINRQQTFYLNDISGLPGNLAVHARGLQVRQLAGARMLRRGCPVGIILVANKLDGGAFGEQDARLLSILAGQAAMALENAQIYADAQENLRDVTRLYAISTQLAARSELGQLPSRIVNIIAEALEAPAVTIALVNESSGKLEQVATRGVAEQASRVSFGEDGIGATALRTGKPLYIENTASLPAANPIRGSPSNRALACLPIRQGERNLGVLYLSYPEIHHFALSECSMLEIFANQAAIALENARLHRAEQAKTNELATLATLSHSLAETMDLTEMFRVIERQVSAAIPAADAGVLFIHDPSSDILTPCASFGFDSTILQDLSLRPGEFIVGRAFQAGQGLMLDQAEKVIEDWHTLRPENQALFAAAARLGVYPASLMAAPLSSSGEKLGAVVLLNFRTQRMMTCEDLRFLEAMADRAALAVRNAQLYTRGIRRAAQLSTVAQVAHRVAAILDYNELLATLAELIHSTFGYRYVHLFINDPAAGETVYRAGAGPVAELMAEQGVRAKLGRGIVGWVAEKGEIIVANDVSQEPRFVEHPLLMDTHSELAVPLQSGTRLIGTLDVQSERLNAFDPSDVTTLETLASQVSIAIVNAELYGAMQEQARRDSLTQVYTHGYFLEQLAAQIERAQQEDRPLALIMLDIDYFKDYNDAHGHVIGDQVLSSAARAISANVKRTDLVGRWGGEEFGIALLNADITHARIVAERIRKTLAVVQVRTREGILIPPPTISQGLASLPEDATSIDSLVDVADAALYRAKARGRDQICVGREK